MNLKKNIFDKEHAEFMNQFISEYKEKGYNVEHEVPYNWYGDRGFIDIVLCKGNKLIICELKPQLTDIGETIRQVRKAEDVFLKAKPEYSRFEDIKFVLVLKATNENLEVCKQYSEVLKGVKVIFWNTDKKAQERISLEYENLLHGRLEAENNVRTICLICKKPVYSDLALCDDCAKIRWG